MQRRNGLVLFLALLSWVFVACGDDDAKTTGDTGSGSDTSSSGDGTSSSGDGMSSSSGGDTGTFVCDASLLPNDCDGDGIPDAIELQTGTDPGNPDSDGDGFCDGSNSVGDCLGGVEDRNNNGKVDENELDPRTEFTGGTGIPDGDNPIAAVCNADTYASVTAQDATTAGSVLALPSSFGKPIAQGAASAVTFSDPAAGVFGYAIAQTTSDNIGTAHLQNMAALGANNKRLNIISSRFTSWLEAEMNPDARDVVGSIGSFGYGAGSDNDPTADKDPATLRDEIISDISGAMVSSGETSAACTSIKNYHLTELRSDGSLITIGAVVCEENSTDDVQLFLDDLLTGTLHAPGGSATFLPGVQECDVTAATESAGVVDFLWVIDNSGSMSDEQANVAETTSLFLDRLQSSGADWRLAVTTTDAYCYGESDILYNGCKVGLAADPLREACSGLRGAGFIDSTADVETLFTQYVSENEGCIAPPTGIAGDVGKNVCGFGLETGLESSVYVLDQLAKPADQRDAACPAGPEFTLREDADLIVIFVADEEDQKMKEGTSSNILAVDDAVRLSNNTMYTDRLSAFGATAFAIVGDPGVNSGGVCTELVGGEIIGAEYGLGYIDASDSLGGAAGSICSSDLVPTVEAIMRQIVSAGNGYELTSSRPVVSSIKVATSSGGAIPRIDKGEGHWEYDPKTNSITFFNVTLRPGDDIIIAYLSWEQRSG